jgi:formylmethanofuran dehydrogenase subunit B
MPQDSSPAHAPDQTVADVTCTACGCLCDDLIVKTREGRIVEAVNACAVGQRWFFADHSHQGLPAATVAGVAAAPEVALERAAEILTRANAPVVLGLTGTTTEAVAAALAVADRIGAVIDPGTGEADRARLFATQRVGRVSATLGEVKNRADVVLFWGVDPLVTHPRHWERYSVEPQGRFVPGRQGRQVIVADIEKTATAARADRFVTLRPDAEFETLWTLRALVRGAKLDSARVRQATGLELEALGDLVAQLKRATYGAWFYDARLGRGPGGAARVEAALTLVRDLNAFTRFVILGLGAPGNAAGAEAVVTWQTGFASAVSLARGSPRSLHGVTSAETQLAQGAADAALIVADTAPGGLSDAAQEHLARIPRVVIAPRATVTVTAPGQTAAVAFDAATYGIDAPGTVTRCDGVALPLRPPLIATAPTDRHWLEALEKQIQARSRDS